MNTILKRIASIELGRFKNPKHINVVQFVVRAIGMFVIISERFERFVTPFLAAAEKENEVFHRVDRTLITSQMNAADSERLNFFIQIREMLRALLRSFNPAVVVAAEKLLRVSDIYGGRTIRNIGTKERTGYLTNFIEDLEDKFEEEVEITNIGQALQLLKEANSRYIELRDSRIESDSEYGLQAMQKARSDSDRTMRVLFQEVSNAAEYGDWQVLSGFINYINAGIRQYNWGTGSNSPEESGGGEVELKTVRLTFKKTNGTKVVITGVENGTYQIPQVEDGYIWLDEKKEQRIPTGIFPSKNTTFVELPLGEKVKIEFQYLSGLIETLYGNTGTKYVIPSTSSKITIWLPTPTGLFPSIPTLYVETLADDENNQQGGGSQEETSPKVTFVYPDGREEVRYFAVGEKIVPPEPPAGYIWNYHPNYMPDHDLTVDCLEDE